ncbi:ABC-F family ATP-binding cassette domain-containing protein [Bacteriovorax sp. BSW11_IV]|uniref:ABC-F family ATP-binding cassette domain-containing protein n=1 Tax=Bacteriovorax sp. BSW11_IV TaxID=1353529 RepID=UPI0005596237|nr:ABC-F family ATP-binding cassette domain-containing protein [Bacteriovorax sp. BSW11_IV]
MIQVSGLSKHYGSQVVFEDITFQVGSRERIGLVGRNGAGKSTLFRLILGNELPDGGQISIPKGYQIGALDQHISFTKSTVLDECCQVLKGDAVYDQYKAEKILFGLGFTKEDLDKDPKSFSGGYQVRINLCKALLLEPNLLLLDEPTNYLDIVSLRWLKGFLRSFDGEVVIITHDRDFMDSVVTHVMGISRSKLKKIKGDTAKFYEQLLQDEELYEQTRLNQEKKKAELMKFVERFRAKASKAAQAQSRLRQVEKIGTMDSLAAQANLDFDFQYKDTPGKILLEVDDLSFSYTGKMEDALFKNLKFHVGKSDRIGIIGKNGKGKSTLLNVLAKDLKPITGNMSFHPSAVLGHFGQTNIKRLSDGNTVVQEVASANLDLSNTKVRNICGTMMFEGDLADKKISVLSGGEKSRVMLGKILAGASNLLFLDEPTNHLDMESIESLSEAIENYPGAVLIVTHSESLLRNTVNKLVIFHEGRADFFDGTYDEFLEKIGWESEEEKVVEIVVPKKDKKEVQKLRQQTIMERSKVIGPMKEKIEKLEKQIMTLESYLEVKNNEMTEASSKADGKKITELSQEISLVNKKIDELFLELSDVSETYEIENSKYEDILKSLE